MDFFVNLYKKIFFGNNKNMEKDNLKNKIDNQIEKLKKMVISDESYEDIKKEQRILNDLLAQYLKE